LVQLFIWKHIVYKQMRRGFGLPNSAESVSWYEVIIFKVISFEVCWYKVSSLNGNSNEDSVSASSRHIESRGDISLEKIRLGTSATPISQQWQKQQQQQQQQQQNDQIMRFQEKKNDCFILEHSKNYNRREGRRNMNG